jgi:sugar phosphate isomerase/epimerase
MDIELNWGTVNQGDLAALIDSAAQAGFASVTVPLPWYRAARSAGATDAELRGRLDDAGLRVGYIDALTAEPAGGDLGGAEIFPADRVRACLAAGLALGASRLNVAHYGGDATLVGRPQLDDSIASVAAEAAEAGLGVVVEAIPGTGIPDLASALALLDRVAAPNAGLLLDTWHHYRSVATIAAGRSVPYERVHAVQLADMPSERIGSWQHGDPDAVERNRAYRPMTGRLLPGEGVLPLREVVAAFAAAHPAEPVGIEVFSDSLRAMPVPEVAAVSAASLLRLF